MPSSLVPGSGRGVTSVRNSRRAVALYLLVIAGPTLVLLVLGLRAVQQQREAIDRLAEANRHLVERQAVDAIEARVAALAADCLHQARTTDVVARTDWDTSSGLHAARAVLRRVQQRHPIAADFFVIAGGTVHLPRSQPWLPREGPALDGESPRAARDVQAAMSAEREGQWAAALRSWLDVSLNARSEDLRAFTLSRVARAQERLGRPDDARRTWLAATRAVDTFDGSGRPQALIAGLELLRLATAGGKDARHIVSRTGTTGGLQLADDETASIESLRRHLARAHWDLTEDESAYFWNGLADAGFAAAPSPGGLDIAMRRAALARTLGTQFRHAGPLSPGQVYTAVFGDTQSFYVVAGGAAGADPSAPWLLGITLDLAYVGAYVFQDVVSGLRARTPLEIAGSGGTPFRSVLPFWHLVSRPDPSASPSYEKAIFGLTTAAVLGVLLLGVVFLLRDVSRERATARLRTDLVGGVGHELKTPLSVIRLYAEMLASDPDARVEERRSFYDVISAESERLSHLIDRVLDFSRLTRGDQEYSLRPVELGAVVTRVTEGYRRYLRQQGFVLELEVTGYGPVIDADEEAVSRCVISLVENAMKYSDEDRHIRVRVLTRPGEAVVEVEDRGLGIAPADRARLFDRFYRGSRTQGRGGYGLGLYMVARTLEVHGGRVEVASEEGRGSTFRLVFPASRESATPLEDANVTGAGR